MPFVSPHCSANKNNSSDHRSQSVIAFDTSSKKSQNPVIFCNGAKTPKLNRALQHLAAAGPGCGSRAQAVQMEVAGSSQGGTWLPTAVPCHPSLCSAPSDPVAKLQLCLSSKLQHPLSHPLPMQTESDCSEEEPAVSGTERFFQQHWCKDFPTVVPTALPHATWMGTGALVQHRGTTCTTAGCERQHSSAAVRTDEDAATSRNSCHPPAHSSPCYHFRTGNVVQPLPVAPLGSSRHNTLGSCKRDSEKQLMQCSSQAESATPGRCNHAGMFPKQPPHRICCGAQSRSSGLSKTLP